MNNGNALHDSNTIFPYVPDLFVFRPRGARQLFPSRTATTTVRFQTISLSCNTRSMVSRGRPYDIVPFGRRSCVKHSFLKTMRASRAEAASSPGTRRKRRGKNPFCPQDTSVRSLPCVAADAAAVDLNESVSAACADNPNWTRAAPALPPSPWES